MGNEPRDWAAACFHVTEATAPSVANPQTPIDCSLPQYATQNANLLGRPGVVNAVLADHVKDPSTREVAHLRGLRSF